MGVKWVMIKKEGRGENNIYKGLPRKMKGGKIRNFVKVLLWMLNVQNDFHFFIGFYWFFIDFLTLYLNKILK